MEPSPLADILMVAGLLFVNGFFVAAEFALVASRGTRIDQMVAEGSRGARIVQRAQADPNRFISMAQLGITIASLLLGWLGEAAIARYLEAPLHVVLPGNVVGITSNILASILAILTITFLHISLGEQVPKMLALQRPESFIVFAATPTDALAKVFRPFIWLLYGFTNLILRTLKLEFHAEDNAVHSPEELRLLVGRSARAGLLTGAERELVDRAFAFSDQTAVEVMVPRTEVAAFSVATPTPELLRLALRERHSRFPVYEGTIDNVVGVLSAKDLLAAVARRRNGRIGISPEIEINIQRLMRRPVLVPQGAPVTEVLARMKAERQPLAVVLDEYGGTAGIVTLKDLVARLLGEMGDEYTPEVHEVRTMGDGSVLVDGLALVADVNARLGTRFDATEVDTLGGLVFSILGRRPQIGDEVDFGGGWRGRVDRLDGLRVARVRLVGPATHGPSNGAVVPATGPPASHIA